MTDTVCLVSPDVVSLASIDSVNLTCPTDTTPSTEAAGGGYTAGQDAVARHARLRTIIRDDDELVLVLI